MSVKVQSLHFDADKNLLAFIDERVSKLNQFYDGIINSEVTLRLDSQGVPDNKMAEIRLFIPGNDLFAKKQAKSFEEAVDMVIEALKKQLTRHKEKIKGL